jgi:hypothetical protein
MTSACSCAWRGGEETAAERRDGRDVESHTLRATVASGQRAAVDGRQRVRGSKVHAVVDAVVESMGTLLAPAVMPANEAERRQIDALTKQV